MKEKIRPLLPYAAFLAADFYLLPLLIRDTGSAMVLTLCAMPLLAFLCALACGLYQGFRPLLAVIAILLFLPAIPVFYNRTAWPYAPAYGLAVLAGNALGRLFHQRR